MDNPAPFIVFGIIGAIIVLSFVGKALFIVNPNEAHVLVYWGRVKRTVTEPGFNFAFPWGLSRRVVSTKLTTFTTSITTVVEKHGSPIQVSAVCVYRVVDAAKALIDVQGYQYFVATQASTVLKAVCSHYPYEAESGEEYTHQEGEQGNHRRAHAAASDAGLERRGADHPRSVERPHLRTRDRTVDAPSPAGTSDGRCASHARRRRCRHGEGWARSVERRGGEALARTAAEALGESHAPSLCG